MKRAYFLLIIFIAGVILIMLPHIRTQVPIIYGLCITFLVIIPSWLAILFGVGQALNWRMFCSQSAVLALVPTLSVIVEWFWWKSYGSDSLEDLQGWSLFFRHQGPSEMIFFGIFAPLFTGLVIYLFSKKE